VLGRKLSGDLRSLLAGTVLGGSSFDEANALTLDARGNVYVAGWTSSTDFPATPGGYDGSCSGRDAFVSTLSGDLRNLLASTFLGGASGSGDDVANSLVVSSQGTVYVAGATGSANFPITPGTFDGVFSDASDVFVSKLSGDLHNLLASTFLGGSSFDEATALVLDAQGNMYVTGITGSTDFPITPGAYDRSFDGIYSEAFVSKLSGDLRSLIASTFLGGGERDYATDLAQDTRGNIYVVGWTESTDFPTTLGVYDGSFNGSMDAFVSTLSGDLGRLLAGTFLGGSSFDEATALALDGQGSVYVVGRTESTDFPTTAGAYDGSFNGGDSFVSRLSGDLRNLLAGTFLGGSNSDSAAALALDGQGNVYVAGVTDSSDFPTTAGAYDGSFSGGDAFVSTLSGDLHSLLASTLLGGSDHDFVTALALDGQGNVYVVGHTESTDFSTTAGVYDGSFNGSGDMFLSTLSGDLGSLLTSTYLGGSGSDYVTALALDVQGTVYVAGYTESNNFPITAGAYGGVYNGDRDAFVSKLVFAFTKTSSAVSTTNQSINLTLQWQSAGATVHHYRYCLDTNPGCTPTTNVGANTSVTVAGITPNTTYYWQVRACADSDCAVFIDANNGQHWSLKTSFMIYLTFAAR
uniref:SBBP repeat-containing protein n=1 Tax=Chloroflexus sp. TaxID=1904827 RepID=UPI00257A18E1